MIADDELVPVVCDHGTEWPQYLVAPIYRSVRRMFDGGMAAKSARPPPTASNLGTNDHR
jgi:hypothetical protein